MDSTWIGTRTPLSVLGEDSVGGNKKGPFLILPVIVPIAEGSHGDRERLPHWIEGVLHDLSLVANGESGEEERNSCQIRNPGDQIWWTGAN
jgi:hypothetical protein